MTAAPRRVAVVGGGITGLAAAHRLITTNTDVEVELLESSSRLGGRVRTERFAGRPVDLGPDSLLVRVPWAREVARELGIEDELVAPGEGTSLLLARGALRELPRGIMAGLPDGPLPFVRSGLMSPAGIARAALDLVLPANGPGEGADESVGALIRRRFGAQVLDRVIDPLLGGVHAGRCDELSVQAVAPQFAAAARADSSMLRGLRASAPPAPPAGSGPPVVFQGPRDGMARLAERFIAELERSGRVTLRTGTAVGQLDDLDAERIIVAAPAAVAAGLVAHADADAARTLRAIRHATVAHAVYAFPAAQLEGLPDATGFLVTRPEGLLMTACTFADRKWPQRPVDGDDPLAACGVVRCSAGRIDDERASKLTDAELAATLGAELARILRRDLEPSAVRVRRYENAMPQYEPGHLQRIAALEKALEHKLPHVRLAGAAYRGSSVPMCLRDGRRAADLALG